MDRDEIEKYLLCSFRDLFNYYRMGYNPDGKYLTASCHVNDDGEMRVLVNNANWEEDSDKPIAGFLWKDGRGSEIGSYL